MSTAILCLLLVIVATPVAIATHSKLLAALAVACALDLVYQAIVGTLVADITRVGLLDALLSASLVVVLLEGRQALRTRASSDGADASRLSGRERAFDHDVWALVRRFNSLFDDPLTLDDTRRRRVLEDGPAIAREFRSLEAPTPAWSAIALRYARLIDQYTALVAAGRPIPNSVTAIAEDLANARLKLRGEYEARDVARAN